MKKGFLLSLICMLGSIAGFATNYYYQGGTFTVAASWNDNPMGGGGTPSDFTSPSDVWIVTSTTPLAINAAWTVAGSLQINGTCTITVANPTITGGITVNSGGTLNQNIASTAASPNMAAVQNGTVSYGTGTHGIPGGITFQNLTLATTTSTCTANGDITINGTLTVNSARTLDMSTNQLIAGGSFAVASTGTILTANSSTQPIPSGYVYTTTVNYNGTGAQTVVAATYANLTVSGARGGADITFASGNIRVGNSTTGVFSLTATGVGSYITTGNTFIYGDTNGGGTVVSAVPYNNLTFLNTSGTETANGNITVSGTLTTTAGGTFALATNQLLGTFTVANAGTISSTNTGSNPFPSGVNWGSTGTVTYAAAGATTIVTGTYNNMTISGNKASATLTFEPGTYNMGGTTFSGTATNVGGYVTTGTTFNFNRATGGATLFALPIPYVNLTFSNTSGNYTAGANLTVNGVLTTTAGGTLALSTFQLLGTPTIANGGTITTANTSATPIPSGLDWGTTGTVSFAVNSAQTVPNGIYNNLSFSQTTNTATAAGDIIVNGTLTTTTGAGGSFDLSTNLLIAGTSFAVNNNGTIKTSNSSASPVPSGYNWSGTTGGFEYKGTGAQTIVAGTYKTLTLSGDHGGATITLAPGSIDLTNNFSVTATNIGGYTTSGNTFSYTSLTGGQTIGGITYDNLTFLNTSGTNTAGGDVTVNGVLTTTAGGTIAMATNQLLGTPTVTNDGTITSTNTGSTPFPSNLNWGASGTVSYVGTSATTVVPGNYNNLTISGAHTINNITLAPGDIIINNLFTCTPTFTSGTWVNTGNTVTFNNPGITIGTVPVIYNNVTFNNNGTYTSGANVTVNGTLTTGHTGTVLNFGTTTHQLLGTPTIVNNGTIQTICSVNPAIPAGVNWNGLVMYNRAGAQTVSSGTYVNLSIGTGVTVATYTANGDITVNGTLSTTSGATLAMTTGQLLGTPTIANDGTISTTNTSSTPYPSNLDWGASGTVSYVGTNATTVVPGNYNNLTISGAHTINDITLAPGNIIVNNLFTCTPTFTSGTWVNTGNTVTFNNPGITIGTVPVIYNNVTFNNSGTYNSGASVTVNGTLTTGHSGTVLSFGNVAHRLLGTPTVVNNGTIQTICTVNPNIPAGVSWNGLVIYNRPGAQTISSGTYVNLSIGTGTTVATYTAGGDITVNGTLSTTSGATLAMTTSQLLGTPTIDNNNIISTTNTGSTPFPSGLDWGANGTVSYGGTSTSTIVAGTYNNLTTTGAHVANAVTLATGNIVVNNNLAWGASTTNFVNTGNTLILNNTSGSGTNINSTALTVNNLTLNNTSNTYTAGAALTVNGVLTSATGGALTMGTNVLNLGIGASTSGTGTIKTANTSATPITASKTWTQTVEFNSAAGQSIVAGSYGNLILSNAGTKSVTGAVTVPGDLTIGSSNTLADGGNTLTVSGNLIGTGTHTGAGKIVMDGAAKTISGATLQNLQLNNAAGFSLTADATVNGTLTLTSGILNIGANNLVLGNAASIAGTPSSSNMIVGSGEIRKGYNANGSFTFPIGDNVGPNYSPISLNFTGGTYGGGAYAAVTVTKSVHPQNTSGSVYINRYWSVNTSNITSPVYTVSATYVPGDVVGTESMIYMGQYSSSTWTQHDVTNTSTHTLTTNANVTSTSADFTGIDGSPAVSVNTGTVCPTGTATLTATGTGVFPPFTYTWAPATGLSATSGAIVEATPTVTTVYTVTVTDGHSLSSIGTTTVTVVSQPAVNIGLSSTGYICPASVMTLTATPSGGTGTADYKWSGPGISGSPSSGAVASYTAVPSPSNTLIPTTAPGAYTVLLTYSGSGCQTVSATSSSITPAVHQWEGGASGDVSNWSNAGNWVCGGVPGASDHILIPVRGNQPSILASTTSSIAALYMDAGTILTMGASSTLNVAGAFKNSGTINGPASANVVLNGTLAQTISGPGTVYNLELNNSAGATIGGTSTDTLTVQGTLTLTSGTLTTNGRLMLYADASTNGRIGPITGGSISGNIVTQMWFQTVGHKAWHFFSHPFDNYIPLIMLANSINITGSGGTANGFSDAIGNDPSTYWIDPNSGWAPFTSAYANTSANQFKRHQGIRVFVWGNLGEGIWGGTTSTSVRMRLYGQPNTGVQNVVMSKAATDYNQVGNPYPSPVNIGQVVKDAFDASKIAGTSYYVWDPALGTTGQYVTKTINGSAFYISSGNAFQVRTAANGNTLIFNESHKGTTPSNNLRTYSDCINLTIYDATYHPWDMLSVKFDQQSSDVEEDVDAGKPEGPADLNFYSVSSDNVKLSSDVRPYASGKVVPLGISSNVQSQFVLKADNVTVPTGARVYLHDKLLNKFMLLTQGAEYPFSINENGMSQGDNRFELTMEELHAFDLHTSVLLEASLAPNPAVNEVAVSYSTSGAENTTISIADVSGRIVFTTNAGTSRNGKVIVPLSQVASGVYLVTIVSGDAKIEKTLIKE